MSELQQTLSGLRVLVAEDDAMAGKLVRGALRVAGITDVVYCRDGAQAVKALDAEPGTFQLVISDWNMPTISGIDLLRYVRMHHGGVKFIMLTGRLKSDSVLQAKALRVDGYVAKPFSPEALKKKVEALFRL
jgi:two-component system chemotaxis response regulator CheY